MKICSLTFIAILLIVLLDQATAWTEDDSIRQAQSPMRIRAAAERQLEIAQIRLRLYERVEYPNKLRLLDNEIKLNRALEESHKRRAKEYKNFTKFKYSSPLLVTIETNKLALLEAQLRRKQLEEEKFLLRQFHSDRRRLLELQVEAAQEHVDSLNSKTTTRRFASRP